MFSHGRSLTTLALFVGVLSIPVVGPPIVALAAIGLALGGAVTKGRALTPKERSEINARVERANAKYRANKP